jgi:hypothetical protein
MIRGTSKRTVLTKLRHRYVRLAIHQELSYLHRPESNDSLGEELDRLRAGSILDYRELLQPADTHIINR